MDVPVDRLLQIIGEEVVKNRMLEDHLATLEASLPPKPPATKEQDEETVA